MQYRLAFIGFGNVAQALAQLLLRKRWELQERYDITFSVTGISTGSHGIAVNPNGISVNAAFDMLHSQRSLDLLTGGPMPTSTLEFLERSEADVMFENTPVNHASGQPAIDHCRMALDLGMHAITANKGTVVHGYRKLSELARAKKKRFLFESTVLGGSPLFSVFREAMPAAELIYFQGILNSTTNIILSRMERGESFDEAVKYCQSIGVAETDPSADVDGWDAAIKVSALASVLMDVPTKPADVDRTGIRDITPDEIARAKAQGKRWKLVCEARWEGDNLKTTVAPQMVGVESPLYGVEGTTSIVQIESDVLGKLSLIEEDPGPHTTAYGLLADFLNAVQ
ncbi:MAG TPA: homoserine dehydrogenase [Chloroflexi bacterium]|nr:homoserine dehydrogenase [Chloroflexota bacterium]